MSRIQLRRDPAATWATNNPVLGVGEPGYETDTTKLRVGDGVTHWLSLPYFASGAPFTLNKAEIIATGLAAADISADPAGSAATEATARATADALLAPKASPALTGSPTAPTQTALDNSTKLGTTAYADLAVGVEKSRALTAETSAQSGAVSAAATAGDARYVHQDGTGLPVSVASGAAIANALGVRRPPRAYTASYGIGNSLATGTGATASHGALQKVAASRGLAHTSVAHGGSVGHWNTQPNNATNGIGGYAATLQALPLGSGTKNNFAPPYPADGIAVNNLYQVLQGINALIYAGAAGAINAEVMSIRTVISRALSAFGWEDGASAGLALVGASGSGTGGWAAKSATDRNSGTRYSQTSTLNDYFTCLVQTSSTNLLLPGQVVAIGGNVASGGAGIVTFHDDTDSVALGTLDLSTVAPSPSVRIYTPPASGADTLTFGGQTTTSLAQGSTVAQVQAALVALSSIGANNVLVTGTPGPTGTYTITLVDALTGTDAAITSASGTITRISAPWIKRFIVGTDIPAFQATTIRGTLTGAGTLNVDYAQYESGLPSTVLVYGAARPYTSNPYSFPDVASRDAAVLTFNTALQAMLPEFNQAGLETQCVYVDVDNALNKNSIYYIPGAVGDGLHWNDLGHSVVAETADAALNTAMLVSCNHQARAYAA